MSNLNEWIGIVLLISAPWTVWKTVSVWGSYARKKNRPITLKFWIFSKKINIKYSFMGSEGQARRPPRGPSDIIMTSVSNGAYVKILATTGFKLMTSHGRGQRFTVKQRVESWLYGRTKLVLMFKRIWTGLVGGPTAPSMPYDQPPEPRALHYPPALNFNRDVTCYMFTCRLFRCSTIVQQTVNTKFGTQSYAPNHHPQTRFTCDYN